MNVVASRVCEYTNPDLPIKLISYHIWEDNPNVLPADRKALCYDRLCPVLVDASDSEIKNAVAADLYEWIYQNDPSLFNAAISEQWIDENAVVLTDASLDGETVPPSIGRRPHIDEEIRPSDYSSPEALSFVVARYEALQLLTDLVAIGARANKVIANAANQ